MKTIWKVLIGITVAILVATVAIPAVYKLGKTMYSWALDSGNQVRITETGAIECPVCTDCTESPEVIVPDICVAKAQKLNVPEGMIETICTEQTNENPPFRPDKPGVKIAIGTITFDFETRVWVLENFITPSQAKYAYDYQGRSQRILDSDFYYSESNPVNGGPFTVCYNTTDPGCEPPYFIDIYN